MGSKSIIFVGTLVSGAFLYYSIYKSNTPNLISSMVDKNDVQQVQTKIEPKVEPEPKAEVKKEVEASTEVASAVPAKEKEEAVKAEEVTERISIPAFGFMSSKNKNQIVALMSDNEKDGKLSKYIKWVCSKKECIKDIRFENNIMDSSWQEGAVKIIELFENGSISEGSLFIENHTLKLEGKVNSKEAQDKLDEILKSLKSANFKIQSYTKLAKIPKEQIKPQKVETIEVPKITPVSKPVVKETVKPDQAIKPVSKPVIKEMAKPDQAITPVSKPVVKEITKPNQAIKPIVKPTPKPEIVPEPFMETTLDRQAQNAVILDAKPETSIYLIEDIRTQLNNILKIETITFENNNLISEDSKKTLQKIIKLINTIDNQEIKVSGFTDFSSDKVYNKVLSQKKADTVARYLKNGGLKSKYIKSVGYGDAKPNNGNKIKIEILGETK